LLVHRLAVPRELAGAAVDAEGVREKKTRALPSVLIVYLNLVLWLFPEQGMGQCLRELSAWIPQLVREAATWRNAASTSISAARERVGPAVMRAIFAHLAGPLGRDGDLWWGRRVCAMDGTTVKVSDTDENALSLLRHTSREPDRFRMVSPELGLMNLLAQSRVDLVLREKQIEEARVSIAAITDEYSARRPREHAVSRLEGADAVRDRLAEVTTMPTVSACRSCWAARRPRR